MKLVKHLAQLSRREKPTIVFPCQLNLAKYVDSPLNLRGMSFRHLNLTSHTDNVSMANEINNMSY